MLSLTAAFADVIPARPGYGRLLSLPLQNLQTGRETDAGTDRLITDLRFCGLLWHDTPTRATGSGR